MHLPQVVSDLVNATVDLVTPFEPAALDRAVMCVQMSAKVIGSAEGFTAERARAPIPSIALECREIPGWSGDRARIMISGGHRCRGRPIALRCRGIY
jgi:hypothetical protein